MIDHPCSECGDPNAPFGYGPAGVRVGEQPKRFQWFCRLHRPDREEENDTTPVVVEETEEFEVPF